MIVLILLWLIEGVTLLAQKPFLTIDAMWILSIVYLIVYIIVSIIDGYKKSLKK